MPELERTLHCIVENLSRESRTWNAMDIEQKNTHTILQSRVYSKETISLFDALISNSSCNHFMLAHSIGLSRKLGQQFLKSPTQLLGDSPTQHQLCCVSSCLQRRLDKVSRRYSATLLQRLGGKRPLWGPQEVTPPLDRLLFQFHSLQDQNLNSCKIRI